MRDHTKLKAFHLADQLACSVYSKTASFPKIEMFGLTSQLRRAAVSVASNIVEGSARQSKAEYLRFLDMAYGSAREVEYQIGLSHRLGFLCFEDFEDLLPLATETAGRRSGGAMSNSWKSTGEKHTAIPLRRRAEPAEPSGVILEILKRNFRISRK